MKKKQIFILISFLLVFIIAGFILKNKYWGKPTSSQLNSTITSSVRFINSAISAEGVVTAQNQATLHFQTAGKLTFLPFKEGDKIWTGQTIASLDTYTIQKQLEAALNTYKTARNTFDQTKENVQDSVQKAQMTYPYDYYSKAGMSIGDREDAINNAIKRIVDQNQANLDNSVINVELANYALQLSTLSSPLNGILLHEDVSVPGVNITPTTNFVVADPSTMVFRANVPINNINYISVGNNASMSIDGQREKIEGTVLSIHPAKVILSNGQSVYQVDIQSDKLIELAKLDQTGTVSINTNSKSVVLVPAWTVLGGKYIWIENNGRPQLKAVTIGKSHGQEVEILDGLNFSDKIITDPKYISLFEYQTL